MNSISVYELETLFSLVIEKLKKDELDEMDFDADEYWIVSSDEWVDFTRIPKPVVGSLSENVEFLKKALEEKEIASYSDLDRLSTILRFISEKQAPINS